MPFESDPIYTFESDPIYTDPIYTIDGFTGQQIFGRFMPRKEMEVEHDNGTRYGRIFVLKLPPGNYYVTRWHKHSKLSPDISPPWKFTVTQGKVTYIGNMHLDILLGGTDTTHSYAVDGKAMIYDDHEEDIVIFKEYFTKLRNIEITKRLLKPTTWRNPREGKSEDILNNNE